MNRNLFEFVSIDAPKASNDWFELSTVQRKEIIYKFITSDIRYSTTLILAEARPDGQIVLNLNDSVGVSERCDLLLDFETLLKGSVDPAITIWLEPIGDKSTLRRLRGIEVKQ